MPVDKQAVDRVLYEMQDAVDDEACPEDIGILDSWIARIRYAVHGTIKGENQ